MWRAPQQMCYKNSLVSPVPHTCPQKAIIYHAEPEKIPKKVREEKRNSHHYLTVCVPASKHILDRFQAYKQQRCLVVIVQSFTDKQVTTFSIKNISKCSQRCDISFGIFCTYLHSELFYGVMFTPDLSTVQ